MLHDLMPFKVKEILLIANLYDAYSIEKEGRFTDHILGEYHQLNLTSLPRVTGVSTEDEALEAMENKHFDLVILMMGVDKKTPLKISHTLKEKYKYIPLFLLLNNNSDLTILEEQKKDLSSIDKVFVWNGDSKVFFAMVKLIEDKVNVENDTRGGLTRVILLVEDSAKYYSRYLPMLYKIIMEQTRRLIEDVNTDDLYKVLKMRARPKILLAGNYEEAMEIFELYKDYFLCVISDVCFPRNGELNETAGFELIKYVKQNVANLPTVLQSSNPDNATFSYEIKSNFINKNSESLLQDLKSFINYHLGFGHFVYRDNQGRQIAVAKSMAEFESYLKTVPDDSLIYHAVKNQFSLWLMARGEIQIAKIINPLRISDFENTQQLRNFLIDILKLYRNEQEKGKIVNFSESAILEENNIVSLASGSLGGKGRGLAFINTLIYNFKFKELLPLINVRTPRTSIIGTDEFDMFIESNKLEDTIFNETNYVELRKVFLQGELSYTLKKRLKIFLELITKPLAIRSSSLFEDSINQPFSGIFETYILPNNNPDFDTRLQQTMDAIKLVYASIYSNHSRNYFKAIDHKVEEEKMAVIIQEVVGNQFDGCYYPHISGTAQSHNFYPVAHMKPDEGFAVAALGLGQYVVEGEKAFRFSPSYPELEIVSAKDLYKSSQVYFYAVDLKKENLNLLEGEDAGLIRLDISEAEKHNTLKHLASVYDVTNDRVNPGTDTFGPRIINFANILKFEYIPLAKTINIILDVVKEALGSPVEIEFAVDLSKDKSGLASFYLLQIKPLVGNEDDFNIDIENIHKEKTVLYSERTMGNGKIQNISDIIYVKPETFDNTKTLEMADEIDKLNSKMQSRGKSYVLIGPGRWGTRDKFIGIPVVWPQISNAKVIVEISLEDFPLDASLGSHFFHNVTSMNVGYFSVNHKFIKDFITWDILNEQKVVEQTKYFKHIRFEKPVTITMDGRKRISAITYDE
ncbi:MAG: pyruvate, phosphate dikinase [Bacteroidetes bacterium GWC2_33_15]|nr:MAG: pyruvate, phosphate dikinase [Bacteroidetes bacterium GWA2_33_15]OFX51720.1 MAG: pyruvate, phosphate dikinase [Bacteroidetes bacterium GWC2_33_15]OFX66298.1 MAG: pyruvate, phosphate dikinase [Bacteroidetes bacterium GWB2_32_14]OFX67020.1 MAG: pyruvate, phosphate dikinase [Bacteroidetes bacterium GWD2_33_33]